MKRVIDDVKGFFSEGKDSGIESSAKILAVYLFGSFARGTDTEHSDIDIAVLYDKQPAHTLEGRGLKVAADLSRIAGREVDLVILNDAPVDLVHRVFRDGILLADRNPSERIRFEVLKRNEYFDILPILNEYRQSQYLKGNI